MSRKEAKKRQIKFEDIADHDILSKQDSYKTDLSEYVLFHFYPKIHLMELYVKIWFRKYGYNYYTAKAL